MTYTSRAYVQLNDTIFSLSATHVALILQSLVPLDFFLTADSLHGTFSANG